MSQESVFNAKFVPHLRWLYMTELLIFNCICQNLAAHSHVWYTSIICRQAYASLRLVSCVDNILQFPGDFRSISQKPAQTAGLLIPKQVININFYTPLLSKALESANFFVLGEHKIGIQILGCLCSRLLLCQRLLFFNLHNKNGTSTGCLYPCFTLNSFFHHVISLRRGKNNIWHSIVTTDKW